MGVKREELTRVGVTYGLSQTGMADDAPEQVYVWTIEDENRPVVIEGWVGYRIPMQMRVTRDQATKMIGLLAEALAR